MENTRKKKVKEADTDPGWRGSGEKVKENFVRPKTRGGGCGGRKRGSLIEKTSLRKFEGWIKLQKGGKKAESVTTLKKTLKIRPGTKKKRKVGKKDNVMLGGGTGGGP